MCWMKFKLIVVLLREQKGGIHVEFIHRQNKWIARIAILAKWTQEATNLGSWI